MTLDILEVFVVGFGAGKMTAMAELGYEQPRNPPMQMAQSQKWIIVWMAIEKASGSSKGLAEQ